MIARKNKFLLPIPRFCMTQSNCSLSKYSHCLKTTLWWKSELLFVVSPHLNFYFEINKREFNRALWFILSPLFPCPHYYFYLRVFLRVTFLLLFRNLGMQLCYRHLSQIIVVVMEIQEKNNSDSYKIIRRGTFRFIKQKDWFSHQINCDLLDSQVIDCAWIFHWEWNIPLSLFYCFT